MVELGRGRSVMPARGAGLILVAKQVHTLESAAPSSSETQAVGVRGEVIVAVGSEAEVRSAMPDAVRVGLGSRTLLPGFTDAHCHWLGYALARLSLVLVPEDSLDDVLSKVRHRAMGADEGEWITGRGWDQSQWSRWPTAADLDTAAGAQPVVLTRKDGHAVWANSAALARAGVDEHTPDPPGGEIVRIGGVPTGVLKENAAALVQSRVPAPGPAARKEALRLSWESAWRAGITGCHDMGLGQAAVFRDLASVRDAGSLGLRFVWYAPQASFDEAVALGLRSGMGDSWIRFGGLKVYLDGTLGSQTARLTAPYEGQPANVGLSLLPDEEFASLVGRAREVEVAVAAHAIGDAAVRVALDHLGNRSAGYGGRIADRVEHAQLVDSADIARFALRGVVASCQPVHAVKDADMAERYWGDRCRNAYPWRGLADAGARIVFGSDAPVEEPDVIAGLAAAVTRNGWTAAQAVTIGEALHAYTAGPAQVTGQGDVLGTIAPGKLADLVVVSSDPFAVRSVDLNDLSMVATMLGGTWAWTGNGLDLAGPRFHGESGASGDWNGTRSGPAGVAGRVGRSDAQWTG